MNYKNLEGMSKPTVCYLVSHGHTARGLTQTDLLGKLVRKGLNVVVISKDANNNLLQQKCKDAGAQFVSFNLKNTIWSFNYLILRVYILEDIKNNPALWEKHLRRIHNNPSRNPWRIIMPYLFYGIYKLCSWFPGLRSAFKRKESSMLKNTEAMDLLKRLEPSAIVSTRPLDVMEATILNAAKHLNIKTIASILSWDNITSKGIFPETSDYYISWGPVMTQEIEAYYHAKPEHIYECGVAHFDVHINTLKNSDPSPYLSLLGLDAAKPYMMFTMSAPYFCPNEIDIIEWMAKQVEENKYGVNMQFIARPHMQNMQGGIADVTWIERLKKIASKRVAVDFPSLSDSELTWSMKQDDMLKLSQLLAGASVCFNSCSTVAIESAILNKPTVMPMFDTVKGYPWWKSVLRTKEFIHMK